jgi:hypothetical protein
MVLVPEDVEGAGEAPETGEPDARSPDTTAVGAAEVEPPARGSGRRRV